MRATESDPRVTELYNESTPFLDAYPDYDLALLPTWVRENIEAARVYGGSKRGVVLPDGRKYHLDNKLNDLTGREWTFFINSVFSTHYPTRGEEAYAHHIRKIHPTPKPPQLMRDLIRFFSKEGELIFDFFMGVGGTLLGAGLFFVNESNWLIARLVNHMTGEIVQDDIILDSGSITDVLNSRDAFFDYIFGTENH